MATAQLADDVCGVLYLKIHDIDILYILVYKDILFIED